MPDAVHTIAPPPRRVSAGTVLSRQGRPDQVDPQDLLPERNRLLQQEHQPAADPSICIDDVEAAQGPLGLSHGGSDVRLASRIAGPGEGAPACRGRLFDGLGEHSPVAIKGENGGPLGRE
jgi:hypothetical protein